MPDAIAAWPAESLEGGTAFDPCATGPDWTSPPAPPGFAGGGGAGAGASPGGGGGEEEEEPESGPMVIAFWRDPCPCKGVCVPLGWLFPIFATFAGLVFGVERLLRPDRSLLGVPDAWQPEPVIGPPDGWVEQLILESRAPVPTPYASPGGWAPGSAAQFDALSPELVRSEPVPASKPKLLAAGLSDLGEPALRNALPVPVGPGPGIPGIGSQPLFPADGSRFEAAPGSLFAGVAPATSGAGFGALAGRPRAGFTQRTGADTES